MKKIYRIVENEKREGLEVHFDKKPAREYLDTLAGLGFRWSKKEECWYHRNFDELKGIVKKYLDNVEVEEDDDDDDDTSNKSSKGTIRKSSNDHSIAKALNQLAENQANLTRMFARALGSKKRSRR